LEDPHTGERLGFATLEQLFAYLMERTEEVAHLSPTAAAGAANPPTPSGPNTTINAGQQPDEDGASSLLNNCKGEQV
jgi:hypothetical protein